MNRRFFHILLGLTLLLVNPIWADETEDEYNPDGSKAIGIQVDKVPEIDFNSDKKSHYVSLSAVVEYKEDFLRPVCGLQDGELYAITYTAFL